MKKISSILYSACEYANDNKEESLTQVAQKFGVDRHSISAHLDDYKNFCYNKDNYNYYITEEEMAPVKYFLENENLSLTAVAGKFKTKTDTIKRRLAVIGEEYHTRYKRKYKRDIFKTIDTVEKAYWLGFILADGYVNEDRGFLKIKLAERDKDHLLKFIKFIEGQETDLKEDIGGAYERDNKCVYVEYDSRELTDDLVKYNLHQNKSGKEEPITFDNEDYELAYIRGMIDGDGHVEDGYFKYVGSLKSCEYLKNIFSKWFDFNDKCKYIYPKETIYSFEIRNIKINKILKKIYSNSEIYLDRKYQTVQEIKD